MQSKQSITISSIVFFLGIAVGLFVAVVSTWADYEAVGYFFAGVRFDPLRGLKCPALVTRSDTATLSAPLSNPRDQVVNAFYRVDVSGPIGRSFREQISIPPLETQEVRWTVNADDVDLRFFIMSKITSFPFAGTPTREATCGIFFLNLNGPTGNQVLIMSLIVSLAGIIGGLFIWERHMQAINKALMQPHRVRRALAIVVLLGILAGLMGWWLAGILLCVLAILLLVIILIVSVGT